MKTTFKYDHYFLYEELASNLKELEAKYSSIMKVESIGDLKIVMYLQLLYQMGMLQKNQPIILMEIHMLEK